MKVASAREESEGLTPQVHSNTTAQDTQMATASVLMQNADFQAMSLQHWQSVLRVPEYCKSLSTYCVLCGQWASCAGFKQHIRLSHESTRAVHRRAGSRSMHTARARSGLPLSLLWNSGETAGQTPRRLPRSVSGLIGSVAASARLSGSFGACQ